MIPKKGTGFRKMIMRKKTSFCSRALKAAFEIGEQLVGVARGAADSVVVRVQ